MWWIFASAAHFFLVAVLSPMFPIHPPWWLEYGFGLFATIAERCLSAGRFHARRGRMTGMNPNNRDEAGPLWLLFESVVESLGFWGRFALAVGFVLALLAALLLALRRKT
jgi:hypothetical protein